MEVHDKGENKTGYKIQVVPMSLLERSNKKC
jgi:hypothetical protein